MIEVLAPGALSTVQDLGRFGSLRYGVGTAGAMDHLALQVGNLMLGNPAGAAGIEIPVLPFHVRFQHDMEFAITGAYAATDLDGAVLMPWSVARARAGQVLRIGHQPGPFLTGARAYLVVAGGVDVPIVLGSRSTQLRGQFGGHEGRALMQGDLLPVGVPAALPAAVDRCGVVPAALALPDTAFGEDNSSAVTSVRVVPAAEYDQFDAPSIDAFWADRWKISAQSDRYGYRLAGTPLALRAPTETRSHGIVPGVIQVPHSGQPIIQMRDAQPSGGYPKIGTVIDADMWRLGQAGPGARIRFVPATYAQALAALRPVQDYLRQVQRLASIYRRMHDR